MQPKRVNGRPLPQVAAGLLAIATVSCIQGLAAQAMQPPQERYGTHDWTAAEDRNETWVDCKSPGDGRTYIVGTAQVPEVIDATEFSGELLVPNPIGPTAAPPNRVRQVVVLQITNADQSIHAQTLFYGSPLSPTERPNNARGISVWPAWDEETNLPDPANTRIAICGESHDDILPLSQAPSGNLQAKFKAYIAVYDGNCNLLWTHHFFNNQNGNNFPCAVTDVSIRVDDEQGVDLVTFCGVSGTGNQAGMNDWLDSVVPFTAPASSGCTLGTPTGGAVDNGMGNWDGFVGRLTNSHAAPTTGGVSNAQTAFLSFVGGGLDDGLFGIDELDSDHFVVVGSTGGTPPSINGNSFPFTTPTCPDDATSQFAVGTFLAFRFDAGVPALVLENSLPIGNDPALGPQPNEEFRFTVARDVVLQRGRLDSTGAAVHAAFVVGSTNDADMLAGTFGMSTPIVFPGPQTTFGGGTDGFLIGLTQLGGTWTHWWGTYRGGEGDDGLTGVQLWNEHFDHVSVVGFIDAQWPSSSGPPNPHPSVDLECATYFLDTPDFLSGVPTTPPHALLELRAARVGGSDFDLPTVDGRLNGTRSSSPFNTLVFPTYGLGDPAGGGIAVEERGRLNIVGATESSDFPVTDRPYMGLSDAVRIVLDMLPPNVGRSDETGDLLSGAPLPGTTGRTTPTAALNRFGNRIGLPAPAGSLMRMHADWQGPAPMTSPTSGSPPVQVPVHFLVIDRPPTDWGSIVTFAQLGLATPPAAPEPLLGLTEVWVPSWIVSFTDTAIGSPDASVRIALILPPPPPGGITFSLQSFALLASSLSCTGCAAIAATSAINLSY